MVRVRICRHRLTTCTFADINHVCLCTVDRICTNTHKMHDHLYILDKLVFGTQVLFFNTFLSVSERNYVICPSGFRCSRNLRGTQIDKDIPDAQGLLHHFQQCESPRFLTVSGELECSVRAIAHQHSFFLQKMAEMNPSPEICVLPSLVALQQMAIHIPIARSVETTYPPFPCEPLPLHPAYPLTNTPETPSFPATLPSSAGSGCFLRFSVFFTSREHATQSTKKSWGEQGNWPNYRGVASGKKRNLLLSVAVVLPFAQNSGIAGEKPNFLTRTFANPDQKSESFECECEFFPLNSEFL